MQCIFPYKPHLSAHYAGPIAVKAAVWAVCEHMQQRGISLLYTNRHPFAPAHVLYMLACVLVLDVAHDAWFYWTHRLLHHKWLYRHVHYMHHQCASHPLTWCSACSVCGQGCPPAWQAMALCTW